ncbi:iron chaperone [Sphingobacterium corticis]|uniref:Iron chaperone n=1 Tax=Sphingobacterium corticis TaxID=1812823 RepID=A0ABW5NQJ2_9SPHI
MDKKSWSNVTEYIDSFPKEVQAKLRSIRDLITSLVPEATEQIAYDMPAYKLHGKPLVYFAAFKNHIGFYATPTGHEAFAKELSKYKQGKGSVQFPLKDVLPLDLIERIVLFRKNEQDIKAKKK